MSERPASTPFSKHFRVVALILGASLIVLAYLLIAGPGGNPQNHPNFEEVELVVTDKEEPGYSSSFRIGARRTGGMATLASGDQFHFEIAFLKRGDGEDLYELNLTLPNESNRTEQLSFNGETMVLHDSPTDRVALKRNEQK